jgi:hypothetical protein
MTPQEFADRWNAGLLRTHIPEDIRAFFANACEDALIDVFENEKELRYPRVSAMGYPLLKHALLKVCPELTGNSGNGFHFLKGHLFEAAVTSLAAAAGADVHSLQHEVEWEGMLGHIDGMWGDDTVFDVKALNSYYVERFVSQPDNDSGYLTQIAIYREALGVPRAGFFVLNAWFGQLHWVPVNDELDEYLEAAYDDARILTGVKKLEDAVEIPPPSPVFDPTRSTKFRFVPPSLKYGPWKQLFYELKSDDKVRRVLSPREIMERVLDATTLL